MFVNTSNRFTNFYRTHKTTVDTLLLIAQLIAMAIALLTLLSILGWALAISQVIVWANKLVEDSLRSPQVYLLMPATDTDNTVDANVPNVPNTDEILAQWQDKAAAIAHMNTVVDYAETHNVPDWYRLAVFQPTDRVIAPQKENTTPLHLLSIRQLKRIASDRKISGYSNLTKRELIIALS